MNTYLLLRSNRQSGPHSFEEMIEKGLKAYDLVWVEGKSAAWRYPAELDEFKPYAPPVEEQPYDRFFVRPFQQPQARQDKVKTVASNEGNEDIPATDLSFIPAEKNDSSTEDKERVEKIERINQPSPLSKFPKYVSVSLPSGIKQATHKNVAGNPVPKPREEKKETPIVPKEAIAPPPPTPDPEPVLSVSPSVVTDDLNLDNLNENYSYVPNYPVAKKSFSFLQFAAAGAGILSLVAVGVLIGMSIVTDKSTDPNTAEKDNSVQYVPIQKTNDNAEQASASFGMNDNVLNDSLANHALGESEKKPVVSKKVDKNIPVATVENPAEEKEDVLTVQQSVVHNEKETKANLEKEKTRQKIEQLVSLDNSDYKVGMFGGIGEVDFTVKNSSSYPLDLVVVQVDYVQSNKKIYKTETLNFKDITPNSSRSLTLPKTKKGIKLESRIVTINSRNLDLSYNVPRE